MSAKTLVCVLCNQKGGVGKTSLTAGLAGELAKQGKKALVIDLTPQGNVTAWLAPRTIERTMNDVLYYAPTGGTVRDAIVPSQWPGVDIAPSETELASREADRVASADFRLRRALRNAELDGYDLVLIDTDPNLGPLLMNALNAADLALVVTDAERFGLIGTAQVLDTISVIQEESNPRLRVAGIVMNKYNGQIVEHLVRWKELRTNYGDLVVGRLPHRSAVATACSGGVPVQSLSSGRPWNLAVSALLTHLLTFETSIS